MINWKVRIKNKMFWVSLIPALVLLIQAVAEVFGITVDLSGISGNLMRVVEALFAVLVILGIVNDPTTAGIVDSKDAMNYEEPKKG